MTTDLAVRQAVQLTNEQLAYIAGTEFVPGALRGNLPAILACVAAGRELGIGDMAAIRLINVIDGRTTYAAELMVLVTRGRGHSIQGEVGDGSARVTGKRADNGDTMTVTWTLAMAERAGLANKQNWKRYPEAMLWARAVSQLCRMLFADCFAGGTYTREELEEVDAAPAWEPAQPDAADDDRLFPPKDQPTPGAEAATEAQKKKLNVQVGKLRPGLVSTEQLWEFCGMDPENHSGAHDAQGRVRWSPLRDRLTKTEASGLIEWLAALEESGVDGSPPSEPLTGAATGVPDAQPVVGAPDSSNADDLETRAVRELERVLVGLYPGDPIAEYLKRERGDRTNAEYAEWLRGLIATKRAEGTT